jgi:hypothetical protein
MGEGDLPTPPSSPSTTFNGFFTNAPQSFWNEKKKDIN